MKKSKWPNWILVSIGFLVIVQIAFSIPAPFKWLEAVWEAGDFITFVGTVVLGAVATCQTIQANRLTEQANGLTEQANSLSNKLIELEMNRYRLEIRPFIMVTG